MDPKRIGWLIGLSIAILITWFFAQSGDDKTPSNMVEHLQEQPPTNLHVPPAKDAEPSQLLPSHGGRPPTNPLAAKLNAPTLSAKDDVAHVHQLLSQMFDLWKSQRRPMSLNSEFTAALTGDNPVRMPFVPKNHSAIVNGELVDRWGTPYQFHQLSLDRIEVRSAGPDQQLYTDDDALFSPWTKLPPNLEGASSVANDN